MGISSRIGLGLAMVGLLGGTAEAQVPHRPHIGAHVAYDFEFEEFAIGAQFTTPIARRIEFYPSFDYYFVDPGSLWQLNADVKFQARETGHWLYFGAGLAVFRRSARRVSDTEAGANLFAGLETLIWQRVHPYVEARGIFSDRTRFQLAGGLNITIF